MFYKNKLALNILNREYLRLGIQKIAIKYAKIYHHRVRHHFKKFLVLPQARDNS